MLRETLNWPAAVPRFTLFALLLGFPIAVTLAWFHGHRAQHRVSRQEIAILAVLLLVAGSVLWVLARRGAERDSTARIAESQQAAAGASPAAAVPEKSIAVLPFVDLSEKRDQEYFADGMAEEIINLLVKIPDLKVIGRTSSFQFKGKTDDLRKVGAALGAANVVEGSVRRSGDRIRVTAQLIDTRDGTHRWSETYDRAARDALAVQDEITGSLVRALQLEVIGSAALRSRVLPRDVQSYDAYLRGLHAFNRFDQPGFDEALADFRRTLELDPSFVPAAEQLARTLCDQPSWGLVPPAVGYEQAREAANSVLKLDPRSAIGHTVLACVHLIYDWDWPATLSELKTARSLAPADTLTLVVACEERMAVGQWSEAVRLGDAAMAVDPLLPTIYENNGWAYLRWGHYAEAESAARRVLQISPTFVSGHRDLGNALLMRGRADDALTEMQKETLQGGQLVGLAVAYQALHRMQEAHAALARAEVEQPEDMAMGIAEAYAFSGQKDLALQWLDRAYVQKNVFLWAIKGDPFFKNLEGDPRYKAFLRKLNLPE
jgi:TolB-like protein